MKIYIAGPYTKPNELDNVNRAIWYADILRAIGHAPFVPHLYHYWNKRKAHGYDYWIMLCLEWVESCDALFRIPGESHGADIEVKKAEELGIPVYYSLQKIEERTMK